MSKVEKFQTLYLTKKPLSFMLLIALAILFAAPNCLAQTENPASVPVTMRLNLTPGEVFRVRATSDQTIRSYKGGQEDKARQYTSVVYVYEVTGIDAEGNISLNCLVDEVQSNTESADSQVNYDSRNPSGEVPTAALGHQLILGKTLSTVMDPYGKIISVDVDSMINAMLDELEQTMGELDSSFRDILEPMIKSMINNETMAGMISSGPFPDHPVVPGDEWEINSSLNMFSLISLNFKTTYSYRGNDNGWIIDFRSVVSSNPGSPSEEITFNITDGESYGFVRLSDRTGWTMYSISNDKMEFIVEGLDNNTERIVIESVTTSETF